MIILIGILLLIIPFLFWRSAIKVDLPSFLRPTLALDTGIFGVYCFTGKQGSGKTYALSKFIQKHVEPDQRIFSNLTLVGIEYTKLESIQHLLSLRDEQKVFIVYDEILNLLNDKQIPRDIRDDTLEFLSQQRKMKNILFTTAQEWLNIPIDFRRFVRIQIQCETKPLGRFGGILQEEYRDAYNMKWDNLENDYVAPRIAKKYSKYEKRFMLAYDTYERIRRLKRA
jgi:hypothetical protein